MRAVVKKPRFSQYRDLISDGVTRNLVEVRLISCYQCKIIGKGGCGNNSIGKFYQMGPAQLDGTIGNLFIQGKYLCEFDEFLFRFKRYIIKFVET